MDATGGHAPRCAGIARAAVGGWATLTRTSNVRPGANGAELSRSPCQWPTRGHVRPGEANTTRCTRSSARPRLFTTLPRSPDGGRACRVRYIIKRVHVEAESTIQSTGPQRGVRTLLHTNLSTARGFEVPFNRFVYRRPSGSRSDLPGHVTCHQSYLSATCERRKDEGGLQHVVPMCAVLVSSSILWSG